MYVILILGPVLQFAHFASASGQLLACGVYATAVPGSVHARYFELRREFNPLSFRPPGSVSFRCTLEYATLPYFPPSCLLRWEASPLLVLQIGRSMTALSFHLTKRMMHFRDNTGKQSLSYKKTKKQKQKSRKKTPLQNLKIYLPSVRSGTL